VRAFELLTLGLILFFSGQATGHAQGCRFLLDNCSPQSPSPQRTPEQEAARERMRECGAEYQARKRDGKTAGTTWREFASECLKGKKQI
jgi:hypothetical protein